MICPVKIIGKYKDIECEKENCALWSKYRKQCSIKYSNTKITEVRSTLI